MGLLKLAVVVRWSIPVNMAVKKHKMNLLLDMAEAGMAYPQSCLMIKRIYLEAN